MPDHEARFWTTGRRRRFAAALALALAAATVMSLLQDSDSALTRGDYSACYSAGVLASTGHPLYDQDAQQQIQNKYWPQLGGRFLFFPYPPYVALMCAAYAQLPPLAAKAAFTLSMLLLALFSIKIAEKLNPHLKEHRLFYTVTLLSFGPLLSSIAAGQYTAISLVLFMSALYFVKQRTPRGEILAGLMLGLWFYKPHFALIAVALVCCAGRWRIAAAAAVTAGLLIFTGGVILGWESYLQWFAGLRYFPEDLEANAHQMVSISGAYAALISSIRGMPARTPQFSSLIMLLLGSVLAVRFWLGRRDFEERFVEISAAVILFSPHTLYYDAGLLAAWVASRIRLGADRSVTSYLLLCGLIFIITLEKKVFPVSPLFILPLAALLYSIFSTVQPTNRHA